MQDFSFMDKWGVNDRATIEKYDKHLGFLKLVKLSNCEFKITEVELLKFFLQKAINLEDVAIFTRKKSSHVSDDFIELLNSWKLSPEAKVVVYDSKHFGAFLPTHGSTSTIRLKNRYVTYEGV